MTNFIKIFDVCDESLYEAQEVKINKPLIEGKDFADELYVVEEGAAVWDEASIAQSNTLVANFARFLLKLHGLDESNHDKAREAWRMAENAINNAEQNFARLNK